MNRKPAYIMQLWDAKIVINKCKDVGVVNKLNYGKCRTQVFWSLNILGNKSQSIVVSSASILIFFFFFFKSLL